MGRGWFGLSSAQSALWRLQQFHPDVPISIAMYVDIDADLDTGLLRRAGIAAGLELEWAYVRIADGAAGPSRPVDPALESILLIATAAERLGRIDTDLVTAAFVSCPARLIRHHDVLVGLTVAARTTAVLRRSAGAVFNVVPLRIAVGANVTVADLVRSVRPAVIGAVRHQLVLGRRPGVRDRSTGRCRCYRSTRAAATPGVAKRFGDHPPRPEGIVPDRNRRVPGLRRHPGHEISSRQRGNGESMPSTGEPTTVRDTPEDQAVQNDELFRAWLQMQQEAVENEFVEVDVPELAGHLWTREGLVTAEHEMLHRYSDFDDMSTEENHEVAVRFMYFIGETFRRALEGIWVLLPANPPERPDPLCVIDSPMWTSFHDPTHMIGLAFDRRTGKEISWIFERTVKRHQKWVAAGRPVRDS
ncbi:hypothetical protein ACWDT6_01495 [Nocardia grenadensis]